MIDVLPLALGILLAQASPGPNMMAVSAAAMGAGRGAGVLTAAGVASGVLVWALLCAAGMGAVIAGAPAALTLLKLAGGGYLLILALRALRSAARPGPAGQPAAVSMRGGGAWTRGLVIVLTNPKAALMWVAVAAYLAGSAAPPAAYVAVGIGASASAFAIYGGYALLFSTRAATRGYARPRRGLDAAFGVVFGGLGARLVGDGLRDLRT